MNRIGPCLKQTAWFATIYPPVVLSAGSFLPAIFLRIFGKNYPRLKVSGAERKVNVSPNRLEGVAPDLHVLPSQFERAAHFQPCVTTGGLIFLLFVKFLLQQRVMI
jgi:hypothetical protein